MTSSGDKSTGPRLAEFAAEAEQSDDLVRVRDFIHISKDMGDSIHVSTVAGDVVINTGMPGNGRKHSDRFARISQRDIACIVLTQCHVNQIGGAEAMRGPGTKIIVQSNYPECRRYWIMLNDFYTRRSRKLWGSVLRQGREDIERSLVEAQPDIFFDDSHEFELGGRRFELYATPGGESLDSLVVWMPQDRIAVVGNLFGPVFGHLPNLYTIRGDKIRSASRYLDSIDRVMALQPELVITGHEVIDGADNIAQEIARLRDAVRFIHDRTIEGMNAGHDLHTLMQDIRLPSELRVGQGHGKVSWCVRAIWEEYAGWFHYDSTTSLYAVPRACVAADLAELAGGVDVLVRRARQYLADNAPLNAIHLLDVASASVPANVAVLESLIEAHEQLLDEVGNETFSEVMWIKSEIEAARQKLGAVTQSH